ncbi:MAG: hypothetical protein LBD28_06195 [Tannerellaceae bacterium]|nr:hypothetical protein [Tannerellaceae bacterium]
MRFHTLPRNSLPSPPAYHPNPSAPIHYIYIKIWMEKTAAEAETEQGGKDSHLFFLLLRHDSSLYHIS